MDFELILRHLEQGVQAELVPTFNVQPRHDPVYEDPVIDPRETWSAFAKRVVEFEDPPLCERKDLPEHLQPQNSLQGKLRQLVNGQGVERERSRPHLPSAEEQNEPIIRDDSAEGVEMMRESHFEAKKRQEVL